MRNFSGRSQFDELSRVVTDSYSKLFPVEKNGYTLGLSKVWLDKDAVDPNDYTSQKNTKLKGNTWGAPVMASLTLKDPSGKVVDKLDKIRLATIPRITPRGSYIVGGNEYQVANQMIRKPGAYVIKSQKGDEFKGMVALGGERTQNFEVKFEPTNNKYTVKLGQANVPLYPLLKSLGTSDQEMIKAWGEPVFLANKREADANYFQYAEKLARVKTDNKQTAIDAIKSYAKTATVDPEITKMTLGKAHAHLNSGMLLDTATKVLHTYQNKVQPDDPENLLFKEIRSVEDMLHDKLSSKKEQDSLKKALGKHLGKKMEIKRLIDFKKLTSPVESFFTTDNRTSTPEQYNPVHMVSEQNKLTIHGTGGIQNAHAVSDTLREVHPSHIGFIDPLQTPESEKTGTALHLASGIQKDGRNIRTHVMNAKTGKYEQLTPQELYFKNVAFPDEHADGKFVNPQHVRTQNQGKVDTIASSKVDYILPHPTGLFSHATNLIPFLKNNQGNRSVMASKHLGQALSLVDREAPLVQTLTPTGSTFQEEFGKGFVVHAPVAGKVTAVTDDYIKVGDHKIPIYNNFPLNQKSHLHHTPNVKVGDTVTKGQMIADSNFTKNGALALGKNLNVAYIPYPGLTFEDGIVITESASKKLAAEQTYRHTFTLQPGKKETSLRRFAAYYPNQMSKEALTQMDNDGIIKKGSVVKPGQIVIAGMNHNLDNLEHATFKKINKKLALPWTNSSVKYTGEFEGTVTDVVKRGDQVDVYVKAVEPARESDKLSGVHGNKGVITKVIPDNEAPRTADGRIPDVLLNPHGIISRVNIGQVFESAAGKIAKKTGKTYKLENFDADNTGRKIVQQMKDHGVSDTEEMFDAKGKSLGKVHMGNPYILRLAKTGKTGFSARMPGQAYDANLQPIKGGEEGAKSLDQLTFYSMLSHGAKKNLLDSHMKSERNDEFWHAIENGKVPPSPKPSFAFDKFLSLLRGAGINTQKSGTEFHLAPMTDKDTLKLSNGKIKDFNFLYGKNLKEIPGSLFDVGTTGGLSGKKYSHIELAERMPNPVFEGAIKSLTGFKQAEYDSIIAGHTHVGADGKIVSEAGRGTHTGGAGIAHALSKVDIDQELTRTRAALRKTKDDNQLDALNRKARYLGALKDLNMKPDEAYTRKVVPVVPPIYRPIQEVAGRDFSVAPPNYLYQNLGILTKAHDHPVMKLLDDSEKVNLRNETYKASRALAGLEPVTTRGKDQPIEGFMSQITNQNPKAGFFLNKLITKRQDLVGRGVITNGPDLHVDELGVPEKMAWSIFHPFTMREFTASGYSALKAREEIDKKTDLAKKMMQSAMNKRTVLMNRAPSLHKFSIMAFKPKLTDGLAIQVPPLVFKGFNADVDGDAVSIHVPVSHAAVQESYKMFPSQNLWRPGTNELMMTPSQESAIGIYFLSQTPAGREKINAILPKADHIGSILTKDKAKDLYNKIAKEHPKDFANLIHEMKQLGDTHAYAKGFTSSVSDILVNTDQRDKIFAKADHEAAAIKKAGKPGLETDNKVSDVYIKAAKDSYTDIHKQLKKNDSSFYHMVASGARGNNSQLMQMVSAPGIVMDAKDRKVPVPIKKSYAEGVSTSDYFMASYGVRKGMMDRALQTSKPGALNKDIMASVVDNLVTEQDCGTNHGVSMSPSNSDVLGRYLSKDQHGLKRNTLVTPQVVSTLNKAHAKQVLVRSPLDCTAKKGTCAYCFGIDEHQQLPSIGDNIGAKMGQTMSEPVTQFTMRTFHTGGVSTGAPTASGFNRIQQLLRMPKYVSGEASLADQAGKVTKITKSAAGGHVIHVGTKEHVVRPGLTPNVAVGSSVNKGDVLTNGVVRPQELLKHKGMAAAQNYIVDELQNTFSQQGVPMERRVFETVVRSVANNTRVIDAPKHADFIPGDVIPYTTAVHYNETRKLKMPAADAIGFKLHSAIGKLPQFHEVTDKDVNYLKDMGHNQVNVLKDPLIHAPMLKSIEQVPMLRKDWMAQLGYQRLGKALTEGAAQHWKSDVEGNHPVPAFAYGASFGKKKEHY